MTYRAISDYFLKLNVAFFSHWLIFHYIATPNIGGDIPVDVPTNQNIGGDTSPASPAGLTPKGSPTVSVYKRQPITRGLTT